MAAWNLVRMSTLEGPHRMDAEFYQPKFEKLRNTMRRMDDCVTLGALVDKFCKGVFDVKAENYASSGVPFVRISNLRFGLIDENDIAFISPKLHEREIKTELRRNNIVLSKTGYAAASLVTFEKCNISQDTIGASISVHWSRRIEPAYVVAFLNSKYGLPQMEQWFQGNVQMHLALPDTRRILVPVLPKQIQDEVSDMYHNAEHERIRAKVAYLDAERLILDELGVNKIVFDKETNWIARFSGTVASNRIDAEYFRESYEKLAKLISREKHRKVKEIATFNRRGVQPKYEIEGSVEVVTSKHLGCTSIDYENLDKTTTEELENNSHARIRPNDILTYTTGANVGRTNCYLANAPALASNHVNILRIREVDPVYASVFLNSIAGQMQVRRYVSGSAQAELYPTDVEKFLIWSAPSELQKKIRGLVLKSHESRSRSFELLAAARAKVEVTIENRTKALHEKKD